MTDKEKEYFKQRRLNNPEYYQRYMKKWNLDNPEYGKQWAEDNKEKRNFNNKKWREEKKEYHQQYIKDKWEIIPPGVYLIKNIINGKCYVGQSKVPYRRHCEHLSKKSSKSKSFNPNIQADLKQYGRKSFVFGIIEHCEPEQLLERETYYIDLYKPEYN